MNTHVVSLNPRVDIKLSLAMFEHIAGGGAHTHERQHLVNAKSAQDAGVFLFARFLVLRTIPPTGLIFLFT